MYCISGTFFTSLAVVTLITTTVSVTAYLRTHVHNSTLLFEDLSFSHFSLRKCMGSTFRRMYDVYKYLLTTVIIFPLIRNSFDSQSNIVSTMAPAAGSYIYKD